MRASDRQLVAWPRSRPAADPFQDFDDDGFFVFVPAIMSVGIIFSIITLLRDLFRWTGTRARERRVAIEARLVVDDLVGTTSTDTRRLGLLDRRAYLFTTVVFAGLAVYIGIGSLANFLRDDGYVRDIGWLLSVALIVAVLLGFLSVLSLAVYRSWPTPPQWANQTLRNVPLSVNPDRLGYGPSARLTAALSLAAVTTMIITLMVATGRGLTESIDEPVVDWLTGVAWLGRLGPFDPFGSTLVTIAFVALIGLSGFRCRVMAVVYPAAFAVSWLSVEILQHTTDRARPSGYEGFESFPSGHMVQVVFIAGLLPVALGTLFTSRRLVVVSRTVLAVATIATALHRIHLAKHWPLDVLGGAGLGVTVVLAAYWVLEHHGWHQTCPRCPWSAHPASVPWQRGIINLRVATARRLGYAASLVALSAAAMLGIATIWIGLPEDPEGSGLGSAISAPVQLGLAGLIAVAGLLAVRWKAIAAIAMAIAAVGLGVFASVQYVPQLAILLSAALLVPAVLTWLSWQRTASLGGIAAVAVITASALTGTGLGVREVHDHYFGPTHPSSLAAPFESDAEWLWLGGVDHDSAIITAGGFESGVAVDLEYWQDGARGTTAATIRAGTDNYGIARFSLVGLESATAYSYRVLAPDARVSAAPSDADAGFTTFASGSQDLKVLLGSCARRASNGSVFDALAAEHADLFLALGDLHYGNLESTDPSVHIREYGRSLSQPAQALLFSSTPTAYLWDDHDFGPNDADSTSPTRPAVSAAYRAAVPSYDVAADLEAPIAQAFTLGRVRFVMTDTRSQRDSVSMLGQSQLAWLLDELVDSSSTHAVVVWANPTPWIGQASSSSDTWASYPEERARIAQTIVDADITNLVMVSGDAHMVAIDDGSNTGYAQDGGGFPLLHAGALDRPGSVKGGPYSHGSFAGGGQYGRLAIEDEGGETVTVRLSGHTWDGIELVALEVTIDVPPAATVS